MKSKSVRIRAKRYWELKRWAKKKQRTMTTMLDFAIGFYCMALEQVERKEGSLELPEPKDASTRSAE